MTGDGDCETEENGGICVELGESDAELSWECVSVVTKVMYYDEDAPAYYDTNDDGGDYDEVNIIDEEDSDNFSRASNCFISFDDGDDGVPGYYDGNQVEAGDGGPINEFYLLARITDDYIT